ncbi:MAG: DUF202 domain-containing protein [Acidimicrobiales bacterium]
MSKRRNPAARPDEFFDEGLQHERTAFAWERTAMSAMVAGAALGRYAANDGFYIQAALGGALVMVGAAILIWAASHYDDLHGPLRSNESPVHPTAARVVGLAAMSGSLVALLVAARLVVDDWNN